MEDIAGYLVSVNGNITKNIRYGDKVRIIKGRTNKNIGELVSLNKNETYIKVYTKTLFALSRSLTGTESQFVNYLMQYIRFTSGILAHVNNKPLSRQTMAEETGLSIKTVDRLLLSLIDKQVIGKHKTGHNICFLANPFIFMRGNKVNETLVKLFEGTKWAKMYDNPY